VKSQKYFMILPLRVFLMYNVGCHGISQPSVANPLEVLRELAGVEPVVVQAHAQVGQLHVVAVVVGPQLVQEVLQLSDKHNQGHIVSTAPIYYPFTPAYSCYY
jgi:hypothetical protein